MKVSSRQTIGRDGHRFLGLSGSSAKAVLSPYFQRTLSGNMREKAPDRNIKLFLTSMAYKVVFGGIQNDSPLVSALVNIVDTSTGNDTWPILIDLAGADVADAATLRAAIISKTITFASTVLSLTLVAGDFVFPFDAVSIPGAPQAAIADAPTDAVTNYNIVTTLLGALTSAVNTANAKQNDIATKLNTLKSELVALGFIHS